MPRRRKKQLTILRAMVLVAIACIILGLFGVHRHDTDVVGSLLLASLVIVVPVHFAIEGNRRDALEAGHCRTSEPDPEGARESFSRGFLTAEAQRSQRGRVATNSEEIQRGERGERGGNA
jgi:hypothetical protein